MTNTIGHATSCACAACYAEGTGAATPVCTLRARDIRTADTVTGRGMVRGVTRDANGMVTLTFATGPDYVLSPSARIGAHAPVGG